jgi:hypothetical protein
MLESKNTITTLLRETLRGQELWALGGGMLSPLLWSLVVDELV